MAALAAADTATDNSFNRLFTSSTLTFSGYNPTQTAADGGVVAATTIPATLATATGSSPAPLSFSTSTKASTASPTAGHGSSSNDSRAGSNSNVPAGKNVNNLLIALGCTAGFVIIILTFYVWYRVRRRTSGSLLAFCMPKRRNGSLYRQLSTNHGWDFRTLHGSPEPKRSFQSRSTTKSRMGASPSPRTRPMMSPAPARVNSSFIGRERNNLVRASLNRHQLSTLDEHTTCEYVSEPVRPLRPSLEAFRSGALPSTSIPLSSASPLSTQPFGLTAGPAASASLENNWTAAPLQPRKPNASQLNTSSTWTGIGHPAPSPILASPLTGSPAVGRSRPHGNARSPFDDQNQYSMPRFRGVDHWADYQDRMAQREMSMTSGEYSQAFRDNRDSAADSVNNNNNNNNNNNQRDSTGTLEMFRYHPGEEIRLEVREIENIPPSPHMLSPRSPSSLYSTGGGGGSGYPISPPPLPLQPIAPQQPAYQSPLRTMHSAYTPGSRLRHQERASYGSLPLGGDGTNDDGERSVSSHSRHESEATVFKYHPGEEVHLDRAGKIRSEDLDAYFGPSNSTSSR